MLNFFFGRRFTLWDIAFVITMAGTFGAWGWWNLLLAIPWVIIGVSGEEAAMRGKNA